MGGYFFDASAIVKRYVIERGTQWVRQVTAPGAGNALYLVRVSGVEVVSGLVRHVPAIPANLLAPLVVDFKVDFQRRYQLVEVTEAVVERAMELAEKHRLRAYDAIQLAGATELHTVRASMGLAGLVLVSADQRLNAAASIEGLTVDDPNSHP